MEQNEKQLLKDAGLTLYQIKKLIPIIKELAIYVGISIHKAMISTIKVLNDFETN